MKREDYKDSPKLKITLVRSLAGCIPNQRKTAKAMGLGKKISNYAVMANNDTTWGMIRVVSHLVKVEGVN